MEFFLEKRSFTMHHRDRSGHINFYLLDDRVEGRLFQDDGSPDYSVDGSHGVVRFYGDEIGKFAQFYTRKLINRGIAVFAYDGRYEDWKTALSEGSHRFFAFYESEIHDPVARARLFAPELEWLLAHALSGRGDSTSP